MYEVKRNQYICKANGKAWVVNMNAEEFEMFTDGTEIYLRRTSTTLSLLEPMSQWDYYITAHTNKYKIN